MPYGDDLYKKENIFAYTGKIGQSPTVYFRRNIINETGQKMVEYGRITQDHNNRFNVGRAEVSQSSQYDIKNEKFKQDDGTTIEKNVEYAVLPKKNQKPGSKIEYEYRDFHTSRNPHKEVKPDDDVTRNLLASALEAHQNIKPKSSKIYVENRVKEFENDKDFSTQLNELDAKIDQMAEQSIKNNKKSKKKYKKIQKRLKDRVQKKRVASKKKVSTKKSTSVDKDIPVVKTHKRNKPDLSNLGKPLNSDKKEIVDRVKAKRKNSMDLQQSNKTDKKRRKSASF